MGKTGATGSGPEDGGHMASQYLQGKCLAKHTCCSLLEEQAVSRKLLPCLRLFLPIQYNWANNFLLNVDGKSPISCPDQGTSIIAFAVRGGFFAVGPADWTWLRTWTW